MNIQKFLTKREYITDPARQLPNDFKNRIIDFVYFLLAFNQHDYHWNLRKKDIWLLLDENNQLETVMRDTFKSRLPLPNGDPYIVALNLYAVEYRAELENQARQIPMPPSHVVQVNNNKCMFCNRELYYLLNYQPTPDEAYYPDEFPPVIKPQNQFGPHLFKEDSEEDEESL